MVKPIILGVEGSAKELALKAGAGIAIEPENEDELVAATCELADDPVKRTLLGQAGYSFVVDKNNLGAKARDYGNIIATTGKRAKKELAVARV